MGGHHSLRRAEEVGRCRMKEKLNGRENNQVIMKYSLWLQANYAHWFIITGMLCHADGSDPDRKPRLHPRTVLYVLQCCTLATPACLAQGEWPLITQ